MSPQIDVTIKGHDQLSPTMRECRGSVTDFNQALEVAGKVARTVGQIYEATVGEYLEYADVVGDLSSITGESTESTSRFITVLGDFGIEMGQITAMGRAMRDEGLTPTLETLAQLSDRYLALAPGMERTNFLYETLGRNGAQFTDVLDQGSAAIMERAGLVREGNILTQQEIEEADALRVKEEELNDAWHNITRTIAGEVLPTVTDLLQGLIDLGDAHIYAYGPHGQILYEISGGLGSLDARTRDAAGGMDEGERSARGLGDAINALPTTHTTTVTLDTSGAIQVLDDYMARLTAAGIWTFSGVGGFNVGAGGQVVVGAGGQVVVGGTQPGTSPEVWTAENANYLARKRYWESLHPGQTYSGAAAGGPLGPITEVGEEGTEGIIAGIVVPHDLWEQLKQLGLLPDQQAQKGGDVKIPIWQPKKSGSSAGIKSGGEIKSGGGNGTGGGETATVADIAAEVQQASAQESAALVASIPAAAASAASEQGRQQAVEIRASSAENTGVLRQVLWAIEKLNRTFPTVVRDAIERTM